MVFCISGPEIRKGAGVPRPRDGRFGRRVEFTLVSSQSYLIGMEHELPSNRHDHGRSHRVRLLCDPEASPGPGVAIPRLTAQRQHLWT